MTVTEFKQTLIQKPIPTYSKGEETFNWVSHLIGVGLGLLSLILLLVFSYGKNYSHLAISSFLFYSLSLIALYGMSTIYHCLDKDNPWKRLFRLIDHNTIYILILGTYAPICATVLADSPYGLAMFITLCASAVIGTVLNLIDMNNKFTKVITVILYVVMGWCLLIFYPAIAFIPSTAFYWILSGGILYTVGVIFYALGKNKKWMHSIFHLFVLGASILQLVGILLIVM